MVTPAQIDRAKALLLDDDFRVGVTNAADRAVYRLVENWTSGSPVVAGYALCQLLSKAAGRLRAAGTDHDVPMAGFLGGQLASSARMLRELLDLVGRAGGVGPGNLGLLRAATRQG